jgi:hypothetical protein
MSTDLQKYIETLPVHTFLLSEGSLMIGRLMESHPGAVLVNALCSIETMTDETQMTQIIMPLMPLNIEETSTIFRQHLVLQTPANFALKKCYCDTLLKIKVNKVISQPQSNSSSLETTDQILDSNPFKFRWND